MSLPFDEHVIPGWVHRDGPRKDVVVSSRVRLARNVEGLPFPDQASSDQLKELRRRVAEISLGAEGDSHHEIQLDEIPDRVLNVLIERRLVAEGVARRPAALHIPEQQDEGVVVNEEDHFRIQALQSGYDLGGARDRARHLEQTLGETFPYARHDRWGFLTSCPTNLGTGLRGSVLVQLPALVLSDQIDQIFKAVANLGLTVRGFYGEGTESQGFFFQISNQVTLGQPVTDLLGSLERVTEQIIRRERESREDLLAGSDATSVRDQIGRAVGILTHAHEVSSREALKLLSFVRFGVVADEVEEIDRRTVDRLLIQIQPAHLEVRLGESLADDERDQYRAQCLRKALSDAHRALNSDE